MSTAAAAAVAAKGPAAGRTARPRADRDGRDSDEDGEWIVRGERARCSMASRMCPSVSSSGVSTMHVCVPRKVWPSRWRCCYSGGQSTSFGATTGERRCGQCRAGSLLLFMIAGMRSSCSPCWAPSQALFCWGHLGQGRRTRRDRLLRERISTGRPLLPFVGPATHP
eukprot:SAG22_NODE_511_length_9594_cov_4.553449_7_plen_167_part_00